MGLSSEAAPSDVHRLSSLCGESPMHFFVSAGHALGVAALKELFHAEIARRQSLLLTAKVLV